MSADSTPQANTIPVKRHEVNLTLDDIFGPLLQTASRLSQAGPDTTVHPDVVQHMQTVSELVSQLKDVISKINQIDPTVLAPPPGAPPRA